jgi:hypothetical protein
MIHFIHDIMEIIKLPICMKLWMEVVFSVYFGPRTRSPIKYTVFRQHLVIAIDLRVQLRKIKETVLLNYVSHLRNPSGFHYDSLAIF